MRARVLSLVLLVLLGIAVLAAIPVSAGRTAEQSVSDSLTRGSRFTVTITGLPNTSYYIWLPGTFSMTGEPGNQPPVIADNTWNIEKDPAGGPYTIGSYQYNNGNGRTIRDDVAPSTAAMSDTNYYALATTDTDGRAVVPFQTSLDTGLRSYSVKVENPDSVDRDILLVEATVYSRSSPSIGIFTPQPTQQPTVITRVVTVTATEPANPAPVQVTTSVPVTTDTLPAIPTTKAAGGFFPMTCAILIAGLCIATRR